MNTNEWEVENRTIPCRRFLDGMLTLTSYAGILSSDYRRSELLTHPEILRTAVNSSCCCFWGDTGKSMITRTLNVLLAELAHPKMNVMNMNMTSVQVIKSSYMKRYIKNTKSIFVPQEKRGQTRQVALMF